MTNEELAKHLGLRLSELRQLQSYVEEVEREGWYYGPEDQFRKRHRNIKRALNLGSADDEFESDLQHWVETGECRNPLPMTTEAT